MTEPNLLLKQNLRRLGLSENDILIISYLLHVKISSCKRISKETLIPFSVTLFTLKNLTEQGLVKATINQDIDSDGGQVYEIVNATDFENWVENKKTKLVESYDDMKNSISSLVGVFHGSQWKPKIRYFEGLEEIKQIYEDTLVDNVDKEILAFADIANFDFVLPDFLDEYIHKRVGLGIRTKVVAPDTQKRMDISKLSADQLRETKLISNKDFPFNCEVRIYSNKVAIIKTVNQVNTLGMIIEDSEINQMFRLIFKLCWASA